MVLSGLTFSSWQAWFVGIYFVRKPWGLPTPTGFCFHPYVLYAFTLNIISYAFWMDCQMKLQPLSSKLSLTERILADAVILVTAIFDLYFRINFYRINYRLAELLTSLEQPKYRPLNALFRKCWKSHKVSIWILALPRYLFTFMMVGVYCLNTAHYPDSAFIVPRYLYFTLFTLFTAVPSVSSVIFAYDLIVVTTFHMLWTYEDYCAILEDHIYKGCFLRKRLSLNPTPSVRSLVIPLSNSKGAGVGKECDGMKKQGNLKRLSDAETGEIFEKFSFNCFVERFDWMHELAQKYNRCMGPIILGVVSRCVFSIVHSVNAIMLNTGNQMGMKSWCHVLVLIVEASQLVILKLGSEIHERISFWKSKLNKARLLTTSGEKGRGGMRGDNRLNSTLDSEDYAIIIDDVEYDNQLVQDLVNYVCTWDWKVSAAGIFDVDKALLCGIVSTTLTYVIILFQFNLTEPKSDTKLLSFNNSSQETPVPVISDFFPANSSNNYQ